MNMTTKSAYIATIVALTVTRPMMAGLITSSGQLVDGTPEPQPIVQYFGPGPETFADGITWSSTNSSNQGGSVYGYTGDYGFVDNGYWNGINMIGLNDSFDAWGVTDTMTFTFTDPVYGVGGFINYVPNGSTATTIAAYDSADNLIESYDLVFTTDGGLNEGQFLGFQDGTADISSFTLTDNYISIADLTVSGNPVTGGPPVATPESASLIVSVLGFAAVAAFGLTTKRKAVKV